MAAFALVAVAALVHIVGAMTGNARSRQILVAFAHMASRTFDVLVRAFQWKTRLCMIERLLLGPAFFIMASGTLVPQGAFVPIVFFMAANAAQGR